MGPLEQRPEIGIFCHPLGQSGKSNFTGYHELSDDRLYLPSSHTCFGKLKSSRCLYFMGGQFHNLSLEQTRTKWLIREDHAYNMLSIEWWLNKFTSRLDE